MFGAIGPPPCADSPGSTLGCIANARRVRSDLDDAERAFLAALSFLLQAIQTESVSAKLVSAVANYLRQAENDPALPFPDP